MMAPCFARNNQLRWVRGPAGMSGSSRVIPSKDQRGNGLVFAFPPRVACWLCQYRLPTSAISDGPLVRV